jgi:hypothetical protein
MMHRRVDYSIHPMGLREAKLCLGAKHFDWCMAQSAAYVAGLALEQWSKNANEKYAAYRAVEREINARAARRAA